MNLSGFSILLADATVPASTGTSAAPGGAATTQPGLGGMLIPMALFFVMIYFLMIRPQSQQRKKQAQLLQTLKAGDKVVTSSGIVGNVISVKDKTVSLRSMDAKMEVTKSSVIEILERDGEQKSEKPAS
ncbi:MAG TPA: preprotein translocase subunit YajC [Candidatus Baltobacteraceae bacterium]|nr:preprotein translocase subunit YajC [Candidatus Baltobacteraceae bacterium]